MKVSAQALKTISQGLSKAIPVSGQANVITQLATKALAKTSVELTGYDFIGLLIKLGVFYLVAYLIRAYLGAIVFGNTALNILVSPLGIKFDKPLPDKLVQFIKKGYLIKIGKPDPNLGQLQMSLEYWDFMNAFAFVMVIAEAFRFFADTKKQGGKANYLTIGVFGLIIAAMGLISFTKIIKRYQDAQKILQLEAEAITLQKSGDTRGGLAKLQEATALLASNPDLFQVPINQNTVTP